MLVDTSAWIEHDRETGSAADLRLRRALEEDEPLDTVGVVVQELYSGARSERDADDLVRLLARCRYLPLEEPADYEAAATLYRTCRRAGTTVRRLPDCLIAIVAMRNGSPVLQFDADFTMIAKHAPLELLP